MRPARFRPIRRSLLPGAVSLALHGGLALLIVGVTVEQLAPVERGQTLLELDSAPAPAPSPETPSPAPPGTAPSPAAPTQAPDPAAEAAREDASAAMARADTFDTPPSFAAPVTAPAPVAARPPEQPAAVFGGLKAQAAMRIVYVVDSSGSMVNTLSFILDELARSVSRLQPTQSFQIVLFADRPDEPPVRSPPIDADSGGLIRATPTNRVAAQRWLNTIVAGGRPNPIEGLRAALDLHPDLVFVLARGIQRTATDISPEENTDAVLARLDQLNPVDPKAGLRATVIKTIQFVDEDPTGLMQRIAQIHGDGAGSYRLLRPEALGDDAPPPPPQSLPEPIEHAIANAARALADADRDLSSLAVLSGVATQQEVDKVGLAARSALEALEDAPPATPRTSDGRAQLLRARAALLAAATESESGAAGKARRLDFARRAIADAEPLPIVDPGADAQRDITLALARAYTGHAEEGCDNLLALIRNRDDAGLDRTTVGVARLALVAAADLFRPRSPKAQQARDTLARTLEIGPGDKGAWPDAAWRAVAAATLSRSLLAGGAPTDTALGPLLAMLDERDLPIDQRRALVYPRLALIARKLAEPPTVALRAMAECASWTGDIDGAVKTFLILSDKTADPAERGEALRNAAVLLDRRGDPGDEARARALFLRFAAERPGDPDARHALTLALAKPGASADQLAEALDIAPHHELADRWRLRLAEMERGAAGLKILDQIAKPDDESARLELQIIDELLAGQAAGDRDLLARAAALAERLGSGMTDTRRIELARSLLESDPTKALDTLAVVKPASASADAADLLRLRARLALGWDAEAFNTARDLAARREPEADAMYWEAVTVWLELGAAKGGPDARTAAKAQVARLERLHPDLGGEPWRGRLEALVK
ncbi:MAG: hypothetical protein H6810_05025 [Phycisphaeraceae bacterium]|nr:MAG: hypothetical protein H6810_05025 [Phycisphaeraceae bacterium]